MDPFTASLLAFAPSLLGGMLNRNDPNTKRLRLMQSILNRPGTSPDAFFKQWQNSPAFAASMNAILAGSNQAQGAFNAAVGRAGAENTGVAQAGMANLHMMPGVALGRLNLGAWENAVARSREARQDQLQEASIVGGAPQAPNYTAELLGAGVNALSGMFLSPGRTTGIPVGTQGMDPRNYTGNAMRQQRPQSGPNYGRTAPRYPAQRF